MVGEREGERIVGDLGEVVQGEALDGVARRGKLLRHGNWGRGSEMAGQGKFERIVGRG